MEYAGAVLDLDGTVYRGEELLSGVAETIETFRAADVQPLFFSNNPTKSRAAYVERLSGLGIEAEPDEVLSAGTVTTRFLAAEHGGDSAFLIGDPGLEAQFDDAGVDLVGDATNADVLVVSWTRDFGYGDMLAGYRALDAGATFYGTDPDLVIPTTGGMVPGSGAMINAVGGTMERAPEKILGKPSDEARLAALDALELAPERCFVVGDRLNTDIELGERAGMTTVLVRTGVTTDADLAESDVMPDHVVDSLADVPGVLGIDSA
ncbi:MAG: HAD-IIA family hydrolase [Natronomonas sp.]|jgi:4-nitrophenyl phosphatase|uniref:HAD-IIA family hydrolase n=1 Tax=Natronomonas salsuginis TaxID=2217661 RepID=A0A4U5JEJ5_9EURY|nr:MULTISPECIES: HAD-IIA family hydrolase [Natronomonas]MDR9429112.1 HAD-IIA family hydrolase [Natronomonas sp.]TKR27772.1 HAD-IIA family hydrolase [Natronomonas salsuginis]